MSTVEVSDEITVVEIEDNRVTVGVASTLNLANPTAVVALIATNGVANTVMRSDAAPMLSQDIAPTWTATHTFNNVPQVPNDSWSFSKIQNIPTTRILGRVSSGAGDIEELTSAQFTTLLDLSISPTWTGVHSFTDPTIFANGSQANPGIQFSDGDTGIFLQGSNDMRFTAGGVSVLIVRTDAVYTRLPNWSVNGAAATPTYSFEQNSITGMFLKSSGVLGFSANATESLTLAQGKVGLVGHTTTTSAPSAGGAGALPATPTGYVTIQVNGVDRLMPYY